MDRPSADKDGALAFTWNSALNGGGDTLVRLALRAVASGTVVSLIHEGPSR